MIRQLPISLTTQKQIIRVLIVEDEYILAVNLKEELEALGYHVLDIINTAEIAIDKAAELRPNLILMDIRLQGQMDGVEAAERIWNLYQIPIIYVTGHSDQKTVERATLTLPFGYIIKPVKEVELHVAIQTALSRYEREQFLSTVLRGMGDGVVVVDTQQRVQYLNPVAEALTRRPLDRVKGQPITDVFPLINEQTGLPLEHPVALALQQETTVYMHGNMLLVLPDGGHLPISDSVAPLRDNQGRITGAVFVFRDDTQRRLIEERNLARMQAQHMEVQVEELKRLNQLKDDFLATTSHELRTPLASIKLAICMLETVLDQCGVLNLASLTSSQSVTRYLTILRDQCDQELRLVNDLLDMRSLEADAYPLDPTEIALQHWLPHLCEAFQERAIAHQQSLDIVVPPDLPALVSDLPSLTRILSELLNNACKYTPSQGRIEIMAQLVKPPSVDSSPSATAATASAPQMQIPHMQIPQMQIPQMQIIVRNSGIEIAADQLIHIFEPFYRIPQRDRWKHEGTGLGLALADKFVQHLQGTITVTSSQNWVTFTVQLPLRLTRSSDRPLSNE